MLTAGAQAANKPKPKPCPQPLSKILCGLGGYPCRWVPWWDREGFRHIWLCSLEIPTPPQSLTAEHLWWCCDLPVSCLWYSLVPFLSLQGHLVSCRTIFDWDAKAQHGTIVYFMQMATKILSWRATDALLLLSGGFNSHGFNSQWF